MIAQEAYALRQFRIVRDDRAGLAPRAQIFAGVKAEASHTAERPGSLPFTAHVNARAMRLTGIFYNREPVAPRDFQQRLHRSRQTVQMYRDDGTRPIARFELTRFKITPDRFNIDGRGI